MKKRVKAEDRIGQKFGKLKIVGYVVEEYHGLNQTKAVCKCDCGNDYKQRMSEIVNGSIKSCGCLRREVARKNARKRRRNIEEVGREI